MKYLLLSLRFIFGVVSLLLILGFIASLFLYFKTDNTEKGLISGHLIVEFIIYIVISIVLTAILKNIYDKNGYADDRLVRKEDLTN